jgi:Tol biopolymer transport system component
MPQSISSRPIHTQSTIGPGFSPDGKTVLFSRSADGGKTYDLFVIPTAGGEACRLSRSLLSVSATRANWSTRRNVIAFTGTSSDGKSSVWFINPDETLPRQLVATGISDQVAYPSFYPNGKRLAVMDAVSNEIKRIDVQNGFVTTVTDHRQVLSGMPSVSPNGKWIAFAGQKNTGQPYDQTKNSIWLVTEAGTLRTFEASPGQGRTPAWSPDGQWLAFESNRGSGSDRLYAIFIIRRDGTGLQQVTPHNLNANHPVWSPNARRLVFSARHTKDIAVTGIAELFPRTFWIFPREFSSFRAAALVPKTVLPSTRATCGPQVSR